MKTAFYIRVSTTQQTQSQTIEQQLERLQHHAQQQGWQITEEVIFRDDGYSGASLKRPGLDRLRDQIAMAQIERVVITAPDRLARNFVHQTLL
jgi:site-specific DNA recombinase